MRAISSTLSKRFYLSDSSTQLDLLEIVTALRTLLNTRYVAMNRNTKAIVIRDSRTQVELAAKIIADLDRSRLGGAGVLASEPIEAGPSSEIGRQDVQGTERQIWLRSVHTEEGINEIVTALRTLLNIVPVEEMATGDLRWLVNAAAFERSR